MTSRKGKNKTHEESTIKKNAHLLKFLVNEANDLQLEASLYEISPQQLHAVRELLFNLRKQDKNFAQDYLQDVLRVKSLHTVRAQNNIKKFNNVVTKILNGNPSRTFLGNNSEFLRFAIKKGLHLHRISGTPPLNETRRLVPAKKQTAAPPNTSTTKKDEPVSKKARTTSTDNEIDSSEKQEPQQEEEEEEQNLVEASDDQDVTSGESETESGESHEAQDEEERDHFADHPQQAQEIISLNDISDHEEVDDDETETESSSSEESDQSSETESGSESEEESSSTSEGSSSDESQ